MSLNPNNCASCEHKHRPDGGWCYMFREEPTEPCAKHTTYWLELPLAPASEDGDRVAEAARADLMAALAAKGDA